MLLVMMLMIMAMMLKLVLMITMTNIMKKDYGDGNEKLSISILNVDWRVLPNC